MPDHGKSREPNEEQFPSTPDSYDFDYECSSLFATTSPTSSSFSRSAAHSSSGEDFTAVLHPQIPGLRDAYQEVLVAMSDQEVQALGSHTEEQAEAWRLVLSNPEGQEWLSRIDHGTMAVVMKEYGATPDRWLTALRGPSGQQQLLSLYNRIHGTGYTARDPSIRSQLSFVHSLMLSAFAHHHGLQEPRRVSLDKKVDSGRVQPGPDPTNTTATSSKTTLIASRSPPSLLASVKTIETAATGPTPPSTEASYGAHIPANLALNRTNLEVDQVARVVGQASSDSDSGGGSEDHHYRFSIETMQSIELPDVPAGSAIPLREAASQHFTLASGETPVGIPRTLEEYLATRTATGSVGTPAGIFVHSSAVAREPWLRRMGLSFLQAVRLRGYMRFRRQYHSGQQTTSTLGSSSTQTATSYPSHTVEHDEGVALPPGSPLTTRPGARSTPGPLPSINLAPTPRGTQVRFLNPNQPDPWAQAVQRAINGGGDDARALDLTGRQRDVLNALAQSPEALSALGQLVNHFVGEYYNDDTRAEGASGSARQ